MRWAAEPEPGTGPTARPFFGVSFFVVLFFLAGVVTLCPRHLLFWGPGSAFSASLLLGACQLGRVLCNSRAGCRGGRAALRQSWGGQTPSHRPPYARSMSSPGSAQKQTPWRSVTCDCSACLGKGVVREHRARHRPLPVGRACVIWSLAETICLRSHRLLSGAAAIQKKAWGCRR